MNNRSALVLKSARREALFVAVTWLLACTYTVGYCALFAYRRQSAPELLWGMPSWIVWGIVLPWTACTLITCWYALWGMKDEDLGEERPGPEGTGEAAHE